MQKVRKVFETQPQFFHLMPSNKLGKMLEKISDILFENKQVLKSIFNDIAADKNYTVGRNGLNADQVLRCAVLKMLMNFTYERLEFHLSDSQAMRAFAKLDYNQKPGKSSLQANIKSISEDTWEKINKALVKYSLDTKIETGNMTRTDATAVDTNIHKPCDSTLLQDGIRVITRILQKTKELCPGVKFSDHNRAAKKRVLNIMHAKDKKREKAYKKLLGLARNVVQYADQAHAELKAYNDPDFEKKLLAENLKEQLEYNLDMLHQVMDQTVRRVINKEKVPSEEKLISFFEPHSDIIKKARRETQFGHKVYLTTGKSGLILDCMMPRGNPNDSSLVEEIVERQKKTLDKTPRKIAMDGGFASQNSLDKAKEAGVKDVCFAKKRNLNILDMVKSSYVYKKLRNFRAGIEAIISTMKRAFGLDRCTWQGWEGFKQYVWSSVVAFNLQIMATA
nr:ISNCY-like element ISDth2 family transposase [Desulfonatronospira thiodismutans]